MRNFIVAIFIFLIWAFLGMWWYYSCSWCNQEKTTDEIIQQEVVIEDQTKNTDQEEIIQPTPSTKQLVKDQHGTLLFTFPASLRIFKDSTSVFTPSESSALKDSIFNYLNNNQDKELLITGWFKNGEPQNLNDSLNFGVYRAQNLKNELARFGINADKISIAAQKYDFDYVDGVYNGGIDLEFKTITNDRATIIDQGIARKTLYTRFNSRNFKPDNTLQAYAAELKVYLQKHPEKIVSITGHTDSLGDEKDNQIIGIDRANNVMNYFITQGIAKERLKTFSKGETAPVADNTTNEGRAKNRRIEINID